MGPPPSTHPDPTAAPDPLRLRVAVLTYRRPQDIAAALPLLWDQAASVSRPGIEVDILVVDNDPAGSARELVERFADGHRQIDVVYESEVTPGISAARNRALSSSADVDLLVFIDDDERPSDQWLALLLQTHATHQCAAVVGPVISEYEVPLEPWIDAGGFFRRRRMPTGTTVDVAATNNLLLDLRQVRAMGLTFDERFGISGGGDTLFTRSLVRRGGVMVWNDQAVVVDVVPASRATRSWVTRRAFRSGNGWSSISLKLETSLVRRQFVRGWLTLQGLVRVVGGGGRWLAGAALRNLGLRAHGVRTLARGCGMLAGAWGWIYQEYARKTG